jgi:hypothetical protein
MRMWNMEYGIWNGMGNQEEEESKVPGPRAEVEESEVQDRKPENSNLESRSWILA